MNARAWSRWSVFEYMKHRFERTGQIPTQQELMIEFESIDLNELAEGIEEFNLRVKPA